MPAADHAVSSADDQTRECVVHQIEEIFEAQIDAIEAGENMIQEGNVANAVTMLRYPGDDTKEAWKFTVVVRVLEMIHERLVKNQIITKRDIYYRDPVLFSKQEVVDRVVDDIAHTFGVRRALLNITAAAKGLVAGAMHFVVGENRDVDCAADAEGVLIPMMVDGSQIKTNKVKWVILVEKEATFRSICSSPLWPDIALQGALVTAKGYPDMATRSLVRHMTLQSQANGSRLPIFALVDHDPDGIDILSVYKHGSMTLSHESDGLVNPTITWLGIRSEHILRQEATRQSQGLLKLTVRDRNKATSMLGREPYSYGGKEPGWRRELQTMLMLNIKAEIQLLEAIDGGLVAWLRREIPGLAAQLG